MGGVRRVTNTGGTQARVGLEEPPTRVGLENGFG